jgi:hypothetical protein
MTASTGGPAASLTASLTLSPNVTLTVSPQSTRRPYWRASRLVGAKKKKNLTDAELDLFWSQLNKKNMVNLENWKQHFVTWALAWVTSSRPGTVGYGFEAGSTNATGIYRTTADTLRWRDFSFFRVPEEKGGGIGVRGIWRHQKGFRVPHKQQQSSGGRNFTILPLRITIYHQDLALLLVCLAYALPHSVTQSS